MERPASVSLEIRVKELERELAAKTSQVTGDICARKRARVRTLAHVRGQSSLCMCLQARPRERELERDESALYCDTSDVAW